MIYVISRFTKENRVVVRSYPNMGHYQALPNDIIRCSTKAELVSILDTYFPATNKGSTLKIG